MLKTNQIVDRMHFPPRQLYVHGTLPAAGDEERWEEYKEDAREMIRGLAKDYNAIGVRTVLAAALEIVSSDEGSQWLYEVCNLGEKK